MGTGGAEDRDALRERQRRLFEIHAQAVEQLEGNPSVVRIAIGFKVIDGITTDLPSIIVHVDQKLPPDQIPADQQIPPMIGGVPTDVMTYTPGTPEVLRPGDSVQVEGSNGTGTLGFFGRITADDRIVLVSNHHVLYADGGADGDEVGSPTHVDCCCCSCNEVAVNVQGDAAVDCAMAAINEGVTISVNIEGRGVPTGVNDVVMGETVHKRGKSTGLTQGTVTQVVPNAGPGGAVSTYQVQTNGGNDNFSRPGDSGSAVLNDANEIVGLHARGCNTARPAGETGEGGSCPGPRPPFFSEGVGIGRVTNSLGITVLTAEPGGELAPAFARPGTALEGLELGVRDEPWGDLAIRLFDRHHAEIIRLVNHNRRVLVEWHRNKGPAFLLDLQLAVDDPRRDIPYVVEGVTAETLVHNMATVLEVEGSSALAADIRSHRVAAMATLADGAAVRRLVEHARARVPAGS